MTSTPDDQFGPISRLFTPGQIECLVRTAGEAVHGNALDDDNLSRRQIILARRAYHALTDEYEAGDQEPEVSPADLSADSAQLTTAIGHLLATWDTAEERDADLGAEVKDFGEQLEILAGDLAALIGQTDPQLERQLLHLAARLGEAVDTYADLGEHDTSYSTGIVDQLREGTALTGRAVAGLENGTAPGTAGPDDGRTPPPHPLPQRHASTGHPGPGGAIARELALELRRAPWYAPPCLYTVHLDAGQCRLRRLGVPPGTWPVPGLAGGLTAAVTAARRAARQPGGLYGAALLLEEWHLPPGMPQNEREAAGFPGPPGTTPRRAIHATDRTGNTYLLTQQHGTREILRSTPSPGTAPAGDTITGALRHLTALLGGNPPPPEPAR